MLFQRKMPRASFALLSVSLACAVSAALVMRAYARRLDVTRPDGGPPVAVVTASRDIPRGTTLAQEALEVVTLPARFAPPGAVRDPARAIGRIVVTDLARGEVLTGLRLAGAGAGRIASLVPSGMRAVQLPVVATVGVEPGDLVDVLATFGGGGAHTELAVEGLEVLAIERLGGGPLVESSSSGGVGLVVLVGPEVAERLAFAATFATLSIAIRGPDDAIVPSA
jgi:pilus assembly protein CpaB